MSDARYSVIRYMPDPGRGECLNIGILLWEEGSADWRISVNQDAVDRVIRENPRLERDSLLYVEPMLKQQLSTAVAPATARIKSLLEHSSSFPLDFTKPRYTTAEADEEGLDQTLQRLVSRVVVPQRRTSRGPNLRAEMTKLLAPLIKGHKVAPNHFFTQTKTGVRRSTDFFANSGANVALDVLKMDLKKADQVRERADAEAFKVYDVLKGGSEVRKYVVLCQFGPDSQSAETKDDARTVIAAQGAEVVSSPDEAKRLIANAVR